jgi:succinoglycan biosynthesis protein ExoM
VVLTIGSVAEQILPSGMQCKIIVIDNDLTPSAGALISDACSKLGIKCTYLHAPGQNISIARNAGLSACRTRWLAFVDDDEIASRDWLSRLLANRNGAVAVFGPCEAIYPDKAAGWIRFGDYHSNRVVSRDGVIDTGYTSNVLIDMDFVRAHKLQFDEEYGRTGGEDTIFFYQMYRCGGHLAYAAGAIVYDQVAPSRITLRWVAARQYRAGQTYAKLQEKYVVKRFFRILILSPLKIAYCVSMAALLAFRPGAAMWWLMRGVFHFGTLSYRLGGNVYKEYLRS